MRVLCLSVVLVALLCVSACAAKAEKPDAAKLTAERKKALVDNLDSFTLTLHYFGDQDKPFYWLTLCRRMSPRTAVYQFDLTGVMDKETSLKVIDWLADSGILGEAGVVTKGSEIVEKGPCYIGWIMGGKETLIFNFGWGKDLAERLTALRALLPAGADEKAGPSPAKQMDIFIGRLGGYWKDWTGKPYEAPAAAVPGGQTKLGKERAEKIKGDLKSFVVELRYEGPREDKPFHGLTLSTKQQFYAGVRESWYEAVIAEATAKKITDWLAESGALAQARDLDVPQEGAAPVVKGPRYVIGIAGNGLRLEDDLGWGPDLARKLTALRVLLKDDAGPAGDEFPASRQMDTVIGRLGGFWKEWTGKPYEAPK